MIPYFGCFFLVETCGIVLADKHSQMFSLAVTSHNRNRVSRNHPKSSYLTKFPLNLDHVITVTG